MLDSDKTYNQILAAAVDVIVRLGYDNITVSDVAEAAGLSRRTLIYTLRAKRIFSKNSYTVNICNMHKPGWNRSRRIHVVAGRSLRH